MELYIHIPFCVKKCDYCDFLSAPAPEDIRQAYVKQLLKEMDVYKEIYNDYEITTIFIGGGTPSVLTAYQIQSIVEQIYACFQVKPDAEITLEANPGTLNAEKLQTYHKAGINRLSIGLQSADEEELKLLGRIHTFQQFVKNYQMARETGFENINVDIIAAIPAQKITVYEKTLQKVLELKPEHISAYSLIIEEGTPFFVRYGEAERLREKGIEQNLLPSEEAERQMYELTQRMLQSAGYLRYEISNYALPGYACRHNIGYWTRKNYLGLGIGAASMIENVRFTNISDLQEYLKQDFTNASIEKRYGERKILNTKEQMEEFMFLGLRMMCGISGWEFQRPFSVSLEDVYGTILHRQLQEQLIEKTLEGYRLTDYGIAVSNYVMAQYLFD